MKVFEDITMRDPSVFSHVLALLLLCAPVNGETWSDVVNIYQGIMNYSCPNNEAIAGVSSDFRYSDRLMDVCTGD